MTDQPDGVDLDAEIATLAAQLSEKRKQRAKAKMREYLRRPEVKAKMREYLRRPEVRAKAKAKHHERYLNDPDYRERRKKIGAAYYQRLKRLAALYEAEHGAAPAPGEPADD